MATLTQYPDPLSFSRNLKDVVISSLLDVKFTLKKGSAVLLEESYTPDTSGIITVDIRDVVTASLSLSIPTLDTYEQQDAVSSFSIFLDNAASAAASFTAVLGGISRGAAAASTWLPANFLTWQSQHKDVTSDQPEWLTYYFAGAYDIKAKFYNTDGTDKIITLMSGTSGKVYSVNCQFSHLWPLGATTTDGVEKPRYGFIDVWAENEGTRLTYVQRYCHRAASSLDRIFLCENSIGGIDTFLFSGESKFVPELEHTVAFYGDRLSKAAIEAKRRFSQNTGILPEGSCPNIWEFFRSLNAYCLRDGTIREIVLDSSSIESSSISHDNRWSFEYRISDDDGLLNVSRDSSFPQVIEMPGPGEGTYYLAPRLVDYPSAVLAYNQLLLLQSPYTQSWMKTTLGQLFDFISPGGSGKIFSNDITEIRVVSSDPATFEDGVLYITLEE